MPRSDDRKFNLSVETLEGRKLQSGLITNQAAISTMVPNPAVIATPATQPALHNYHTITGFFAQ
jgi:hypothetical protein